VDAAGDDVYTAKADAQPCLFPTVLSDMSCGANGGAGEGGMGFLLDAAGNHRYAAGSAG
jgi:hypothetical protein